MRSTTTLNAGIFSLLQLMGEKYPELLRNMEETPAAFPDAGITGQPELQQYYFTLQAIYIGYDLDHPRESTDAAVTKGCE